MKNKQIGHQIYILLIVLFVIFTFVVVLLSNIFLITIKKDTLEHMSGKIEMYVKNIENGMNNFEKFTYMALLDSTFQNNIKKIKSEDITEMRRAIKDMGDTLSNFSSQFDYISAIIITDKENNIIFNMNANINELYTNREMLKAADAELQNKQGYYIGSEGEKYMYAMYNTVDTNWDSFGTSGKIIFKINMSKFVMNTQDDSSNNGMIAIVNEQGNSLYNELGGWYEDFAKFDNERENTIVKINEKNLLISLNSNKNNHFKYYIFTPYDVLIQRQRFFQITIASIFVIMLLLFWVFAVIYAKKITVPIAQLTKQMKKIQNGDFNIDKTPIEAKSKNEIEVLKNSFYIMAEKLNILINENYIAECEKKDAQIKMMQAQINPHFLYNTLDVLYWMLISKGDDQNAKMVKMLGNLFRYATDIKDECVPIKKEYEMLQSYGEIQNVRYYGRLKISYDIFEDMMNLLIPKFSLQPILENAIKFTADATNKKVAEIHVGGKTDGVSAVIFVEDNGDGINGDEFYKIISGNGKKTGIALYNINKRVKLLFGEQYGLYIEKIAGKNVIGYRMPYRKE